MKRTWHFVSSMLLVFFFSIAAHAQNTASPATGGSPAEAKTVRVLFIGNSYTHLHDLPGTVARLAASANPPRKLEAVESTEGGYTLQRHWESGRALQAIRQGKWDFVVLQEQGGLGDEPVLNDKGEFNDPRGTRRFARMFDAEIKKAGARTVLFLTWAGQSSPQELALLASMSGGIAAELKSAIAPAGVAWRDALRENPKLVLHWSDGSHPNVAGAYLAACVLYATFYSSSPEGLDRGNLDPADAAFLQRIAWQTARDPQRAIAAAIAEKLVPATEASTAAKAAVVPDAIERGRAILALAQKAMGGLDRLRAMKDFSVTYAGKFIGPEGDAPIRGLDTIVFPYVFRSELQFPTGTLRVFSDGAGGWRDTPGGIVELNDLAKKVIRGQTARNNFSLLRADGDFAVQFEKREKLGEIESDVLLVTRDGETVRLFVDPAGMLLKKSWRGMGPGGMADFEEIYSDYREVSGVQVPFRIVTHQNGARFVEITVTDAKFNSGVDPTELAKRPQ